MGNIPFQTIELIDGISPEFRFVLSNLKQNCAGSIAIKQRRRIMAWQWIGTIDKIIEQLNY